MKGIASQMIGDERVFAIGISFYLSKKRKPELPQPCAREVDDGQSWSVNQPSAYYGVSPKKWNLNNGDLKKHLDKNSHLYENSGDTLNSLSCDPDGTSCMDFCGDAPEAFIGYVGGTLGATTPITGGIVTPNSAGSPKSSSISSSSATTKSSSRGKSKKEVLIANTLTTEEGRTLLAAGMNSPVHKSTEYSEAKVEQVTPVKNLEVGAGALIKQRVYDDTKEMSYWEKKPAGMIFINYCDEETLKNIKTAGKRGDKKDGFMQNLKVGS